MHPKNEKQDPQDDYKECVPINQEMDDQPSRGKRKGDEEDNQKPALPLKKYVPEDDEENQDDDDQETIKKEYIEDVSVTFQNNTWTTR